VGTSGLARMVKIKIPPRIHITLLSMHENGYRQNGGIGFAVDAPSLLIDICPAVNLSIDDIRKNGFNEDEKARIYTILQEIIQTHKMRHGIKATISGDVPTHRGFGSSTAVRLALIEGLYLANEMKYTKHDIITASGRGGVSGIGIETYFGGGFVFDLGRKDKRSFAPSSALETSQRSLPLLCKRVDMPQWNIGICIPHIEPKSEVEEKRFFTETCPIPQEESYRTLYHASYGVLASVMEEDITTFADAIKNIQNTFWKRAERSLYGTLLEDVERMLYESGALAVGMSSLGPSLYFIAEDMEEVVARAEDKLPSSQIYMAHTTNSGRVISYD